MKFFQKIGLILLFVVPVANVYAMEENFGKRRAVEEGRSGKHVRWADIDDDPPAIEKRSVSVADRGETRESDEYLMILAEVALRAKEFCYLFDGKAYLYDPSESLTKCDFPGCCYAGPSLAQHLRLHREKMMHGGEQCPICGQSVYCCLRHVRVHKCSCGFVPKTLEEYKHCPNPDCKNPERVKDKPTS